MNMYPLNTKEMHRYGYEWLRIRHKKDLIYKQPSHTPIVHEEHDELLRQRLSQD